MKSVKTKESLSTQSEVDVHHEYFVFHVGYGSKHVVDDAIFIIPAFSKEQAQFVLDEIHERRDPRLYGKTRETTCLGILDQLVKKEQGFQYFEWHIEE